jgi:Tol biopolymer transport system component
VPSDTYVPGHLCYVKDRTIYSVHHYDAPQEITTGSEPALSPDGTQLAFIVFSKDYQDLYLMNMKTRRLRELVNDYMSDPQNAATGLTAAVPAWTDDSQSVLFSWSYPGSPIAGTTNFNRTDFSITECPAAGPCTTATAVKLTTPASQSGGDYDAAARPGDPNTIVYSRYQYETARDNTSRSLAYLVAGNTVTGASVELTPALDNDSQPAWSPDGKYLLYMKTSDDMKTTSIWAMAFHAPGDPQDNGKAQLLIQGNSFAADPTFSPDGKDVAYLSSGDDGLLHLFIAQIHLSAHPTIDHVQEIQRANVVDGDRLVWGH